MLGEPELLLAPEFFTGWAADHPSVAGLDIEVKRGWADNELNRYRYDVVVHKTPTPVRSLAAVPTWAWAQCAGLGGLHDKLVSDRPAAVRVTEIPRAGLVSDVHLEHGLAAGLPLAEALDQDGATSTPPPPNSCTASVKPPDTTSRSPGAPNRAPWTRSSSPPPASSTPRR